MSAEHPSFLALDEFALARSDNAIGDHVESCERCAGHIAKLDDIGPLPAGLRDRARGAKRSKERRWLVWAGPLAVAGAAAAALLFFLARDSAVTSSEDNPYIGVKGSRAVALYIKRGDEVSQWNGRSKIAANDRLRLGVVSRGHAVVAVFMRLQTGGTTRYERIYQGELETSGATLLPKAWQVDDAPGDEVLLVVTAETSFDPNSLQTTLDQVARTNSEVTTADGLWIRPLILAKESLP